MRYDKDEGFPADVEFAPFERNEHVSRRRRMFRTRRKMEDTSSKVTMHIVFHLILILVFFVLVLIFKKISALENYIFLATYIYVCLFLECFKSEKKPELQGDGWMYARHANASYHANKQKLDFFRRRKWRRPLKCVIQGHPAVFRLIRDRDRSKV